LGLGEESSPSGTEGEKIERNRWSQETIEECQKAVGMKNNVVGGGKEENTVRECERNGDRDSNNIKRNYKTRPKSEDTYNNSTRGIDECTREESGGALKRREGGKWEDGKNGGQQ